MKGHLDEASSKVRDLEQEKINFEAKLKQSDELISKYKKKHDEMFKSVSLLNKRIEELESHKLHLLDKLKKAGDKGNLDYIVKTQKLENVKGKEIQDRVQVEDYQPDKKKGDSKMESSKSDAK